MNVYSSNLPVPASYGALDRINEARRAAAERLSQYRGRAIAERPVGEAKTLAEVAGAAYLVSRLSAQLGGIEGKKIGPLPLELAVAGLCVGVVLSGQAGAQTEDVAAIGVGAVAGYAARQGFTAGLAHAKPPAGAVGGPLNYAVVGGPIQAAEAVIDQTVARR